MFSDFLTQNKYYNPFYGPLHKDTTSYKEHFVQKVISIISSLFRQHSNIRTSLFNATFTPKWGSLTGNLGDLQWKRQSRQWEISSIYIRARSKNVRYYIYKKLECKKNIDGYSNTYRSKTPTCSSDSFLIFSSSSCSSWKIVGGYTIFYKNTERPLIFKNTKRSLMLLHHLHW